MLFVFSVDCTIINLKWKVLKHAMKYYDVWWWCVCGFRHNDTDSIIPAASLVGHSETAKQKHHGGDSTGNRTHLKIDPELYAWNEIVSRVQSVYELVFLKQESINVLKPGWVGMFWWMCECEVVQYEKDEKRVRIQFCVESAI